MNYERGTGHTTRQMLEATKGAVYVWFSNDLSYPRHLAGHLGRTDLQIVGPSWLEWRANVQRATYVVIDHATKLTARQREEYEHWKKQLEVGRCE